MTSGFSMGGFLVTLVVLGLVAWGFLRLLSLGTRQQAGAAAALRNAVGLLRRDLLAATLGPLDAADAVVPLVDNSPAGAALPLLSGDSIAVQPGTDQIELQGVLRAGRLSLDTAGCPVRLARQDPARVRVPLPAFAGRRDQRAALEELLGRLRARPHDQLSFLISDAARQWAVGRVVAFDVAGACGGVDLVLDFTAADAVRRNGGRDAARLGELRSGGLLDRLVYFVAGAGGGAPAALCVAEDAGDGRYRVNRLAEGAEDLQMSYGIAPADGRFDPAERAPDVGPDDWWPNHPGEHPATSEMLRDALGRPRLRSVKVALVGARGQHAGEPPKPMNAGARGERLAAPGMRWPAPDGAGGDRLRQVSGDRLRGWSVEVATVDLTAARDGDP